MSNVVIEIGSEWVEKNDKNSLVILRESKKDNFQIKTGEEGECYISRANLLAHYNLKADMVNHPPHYKDASGVGCTEVVKHMMYFGGACFKYLYRCGNKWDDIEDLKKAVRCAELADNDRFITDESWLRAMYQVAIHRDGNIRGAMFNIRSQQWEYVIEFIKDEIARLESEQ